MIIKLENKKIDIQDPVLREVAECDYLILSPMFFKSYLGSF
jgi:hypothetical protein